MAGFTAEPALKYASSIEVVSLLAGLVWLLPVWLFLGETTLEWSLPTRTQGGGDDMR